MKRPLRLPPRPKPDYGIEQPVRIASLTFAGAAALAAGLALPSFQVDEFQFTLIGPTLLALGFLSLGLCASMLAYSLRGKFNIRKRMLGAVNWRGGETVLDIGAGRGLLAIGAAKRLRAGTVVGIDDWEGAGAAEHTLEKAQRNLELARVHDRVELRSDDPRDIAFVDGSFDVVLSLMFLHRIEDAGGRARACCEIARVLKPEGLAIVADSSNVQEYARALQAAGLKVEGPKSCLFAAYSPLDLVIAKKPGARE
jgi:ubiquinone/menaquinone biosynthesis C-methylase UbiE